MHKTWLKIWFSYQSCLCFSNILLGFSNILLGFSSILLALSGAYAQGSQTQQLAKQLANPVSNLISVPFQNTYNCCFGPDHAGRFILNIQPVIPLALNRDWNLIIRTIVPVLYQQSPTRDSISQLGLGDSVQSFFLSPSHSANGVIWGVGPVFLWPTATSAMLGTQKWGAGPTGVVLKQSHGWTFGGLANHIWSYAGDNTRDPVSATLLQPFVSHSFPNTVSISLSSEASFDWTRTQWTIPVDLGISKLFTFGRQHVSLGVTGQYFIEKPQYGPDWGARFTATFLFPK